MSDGKKTYSAQITLTNNSKHVLDKGDWAIYLSHIRMIEPHHLPHATSYEVKEAGMTFTHVNGCLFKLSPTKKFKPMKTGDKLKIPFKAQYFSIAKSDLMPNWYFIVPKLRPVVIKSTASEDMSFVEPFDTEEAWKRFDYELKDGSTRYDHYNPYNLQERFDRQSCPDPGPLGTTIIPSPLHMTVVETERVKLSAENWVICAGKELENEQSFLSSNHLKLLENVQCFRQFCFQLLLRRF